MFGHYFPFSFCPWLARRSGDPAPGTPVSAAGALPDQTFTDNDGVQVIDITGDFSGTAPITYALVSPPPGVTITGGNVLVDTGATGLLSAASIVVRGDNAYGPAQDSAFSLTVEAFVPPPTGVGAWEIGATFTVA